MPCSTAFEPQFLSLAQASTLTGLSGRTLRRAIAASSLQAHRLGRLIRIDRGELRRWVEANGQAACDRRTFAASK